MGNGNCYKYVENEDLRDLRGPKFKAKKPIDLRNYDEKNSFEKQHELSRNNSKIIENNESKTTKSKSNHDTSIQFKDKVPENIPFFNGNFIEGELNGEGKMKYLNGNMYHGKTEAFGLI